MRRLIAAAALALGLGLPSMGAQAQTPVQLAAALQAPAVTHSFLIGRWTDTGDCSNNVEFFADGRFVTSGGAAGRWTIDGDRLSFVGNSTVTARVRATSRDAIVLTHADGSTGGSTRCGAPRRIAMPPMPATAAEVLRIGTPISRELLIGRWTDDGNCAAFIQFLPDGRFMLANGGSGRWTLGGEQLSFIGNSTVTARVRAVGRDRILLIRTDGSLGQSMRC